MSLPNPNTIIRTIANSLRAEHGAANFAAGMCAQIFGSVSRREFGVLMYHRVVDHPAGLASPTWNVPPAQFRRQLKGLLDLGFVAWPLARCLEYAENDRRLPANVFVVTFDDCYESVYTRAFPILRELRVPATCFLATAHLDRTTSFPFDDWRDKDSPAAPPETWRSVTSDQCREMLASGLIELGAHTHTHADFRGQTDLFRADLRECLAVLRERFGIEHPAFAFPYGTKKAGYATNELRAAAAECGVRCAFHTEWETARLKADRFDWGRFLAQECDEAFDLAGKISGWYARLRDWGKRSLALVRRAPATHGGTA